jgi:hypothetical protein
MQCAAAACLPLPSSAHLLLDRSVLVRLIARAPYAFYTLLQQGFAGMSTAGAVTHQHKDGGCIPVEQV